MPSRQFYIQQSCLNAALEESYVLNRISVPAWLDMRTEGATVVPAPLLSNIRSWYRDYVLEYGAPE